MTDIDPHFQPLDVHPGPEYDALMDALDAWVKAARPPSFPEGDQALAAMLRAVQIGEGDCARPGCDPPDDADALSWPHRMERDDRGDWRAHYRCRNCGRAFSSSWGTLVHVLTLTP